MVTVKITSNIDKWIGLAKSVGRELSSPQLAKEVATELRPRMIRLAKEAFKSEGGTTGRKWRRLSEPYGTQKAKQFPGKTILRRTDEMYREFINTPISFGSILSGNGFIYKYGVNDLKYDRHHSGIRLPKYTLPARPVLRYTSQQLRGISTSIGRTIVYGVFSRQLFDSMPRVGIQPGFRLTNFTGFDSIRID